MNPGHQVLARTWRPERFEDVVGQPHVVRTLTNALTTGRVAHAYLFTGPRGIGKTTCARILARAVNCERSTPEKPLADPCGECAMCKDILAGRALDVIELDAASTGGVDEIRDLREVVRTAPARARKKVFIIDEAHMLSTAASNALLKTLEEPPAHVLFILATTDAHKLPATILSRCQRFEFHPMGPATVVEHLKTIAAAETIDVEDPALALIAKVARGAMRDAQMLLEQVAAFSPGRIGAADVRGLLGLVDHEWVEKFLTVLRDRDVKAGMALLDALIESGRGAAELLDEVQEELRDALMVKLGSPVAGLAAGGFLVAPERLGWFTEEELTGLLGHTRRAAEELAFSRQIGHPRIAAELAIARLLRRERALAWSEVEAAIAGIAGTAGMPTPPVPGIRPQAAPAPAFMPRPAAAADRAMPPPERTTQTVGGPAAPASPVPAAPQAGLPAPMAELAAQWDQTLARIKAEDGSAYVHLLGSRCIGVEGRALLLEIPSDFNRKALQAGTVKGRIESLLTRLLGQSVTIAARMPSAPAPGVPAPFRPASSAPASAPRPGEAGAGPGAAVLRTAPSLPDWVELEPLVKAAIGIFKARVLDVKRPAGQR